MSIKSINSVGIDTAKQLISMMAIQVKNGLIKPSSANICLHGSPGLGKSAIVAQVAKELGFRLIDLRLSAMEASDVLGIPYTFNGEMRFSTPEWWPVDGVPCIIFLDELKSAPPAVQTAAYRLILDRSIQNGKVLPDNCMIVAAGNLKEDKTGARDLLPAAANRFAIHLIVDKSQALEPFLNYAVANGLHRSVVGYLTWKRDAIYGVIGDEAAYASPRTWEAVSNMLGIQELSSSVVLRNIAIAGAVGSSEAMSFAGYLENDGKLPDWKRVRSGDTSYEYSIERGDTCLEYAVAVGIAFEILDAIDKNAADEIDRLGELLDVVGDDMSVVAFRTMRRNPKAPMVILRTPSLKSRFEKIKTHLK